MAKKDRKGRTRSHFSGNFVGLEYGVIQSPAFRHSSGDAIKVLLDAWSRYSHKDPNNGHISYSVREAASLLQSGKDRARRTLDELVDKGFLVPTRLGAFSVKLKLATTWRITLIATASTPATREYQHWRPPLTVPNSGTDDDKKMKNTVPDISTNGTQGRYRTLAKRRANVVSVPDAGTEKAICAPVSVPDRGTHLDSAIGTAMQGIATGVSAAIADSQFAPKASPEDASGLASRVRAQRRASQ